MTYNFDSHQCTAIRPSQFTCDWGNVTAELGKRGLLTDKLKQGSQTGAKLVSCGESQDGHRIVVQWIEQTNAPQGSCTYDPNSNHITTGCYTLYAGAAPPAPTTEDEKRAQVYACMNQL